MPQRRVVANYKRGPQGNLVPDYAKDAEDLYGKITITGPLGSPGITDIRDNRDPAAVGAELLAEREAVRTSMVAPTNGHKPKITYHEKGSYGDIAP